MTISQYRDWQEFYSFDPWGEWRADHRQYVLLANILRPFQKFSVGQPPNIVWPYFDQLQGDDAGALKKFMDSFDAALVEKEGGGYKLTITMEELVDRAK